jgi:uncharacterized membrane protein
MFETSHFHPMIVHFPVALITVGFLFDLAFIFYKKEFCLSKAGFYLMILGTLGAIAAYTTGQLFTDEPTQGEIVKTFTNHETGALITMISMILASIVRIYLVMGKKEESGFKWLSFVLYLIGFLAVGFTGFMGGNMVYNFMLGI